MDEGCYILAARHPDQGLFIPFSSAQQYASALLWLAGGNIVSVRRLGLVLLCASSIFLLLSVQRAIARTFAVPSGGGTIVGGALACMGGLFYYLWVPGGAAFTSILAVPNYNLLTAVCLNLVTGTFAQILSRSGAAHTLPLTAWLVSCGVSLGVLTLVRWPSAIVLVPLVAFFIWKNTTATQGNRWLPLLLTVAGMAGWLIFHFMVVEGFRSWWAANRALIAYVRLLDAGHGLAALLRQLALLRASAKGVIALLLVPLLVLALPFQWREGRLGAWLRAATTVLSRAAGSLLHNGGSFAPEAVDESPAPSRRIVLACASLACGQLGLLLGPLRNREYVLGLSVVAAPILLFALLALGKASTRNRGGQWSSRGNSMRLLLLLFALPFIGSFGSNNLITLKVLVYLAPWGVLFWLLGAWTLGVARLDAQVLTSGLFVVAMPLHVYDSGALRKVLPRIAAPIVVERNAPWDGLSLLPEEISALRTLRLRARTSGFENGSELVALYDMPWMVDVLGGVSPGIPWWDGVFLGSKKAAEYLLAGMDPEARQRTYFLTRSKAQAQLPDLHRFGVLFPEKYELVASVLWPRTGDVLQLWKPLRLKMNGT